MFQPSLCNSSVYKQAYFAHKTFLARMATHLVSMRKTRTSPIHYSQAAIDFAREFSLLLGLRKYGLETEALKEGEEATEEEALASRRSSSAFTPPAISAAATPRHINYLRGKTSCKTHMMIYEVSSERNSCMQIGMWRAFACNISC